MNTLAAIHVGKKQLGLDDDTYRALLVRVTGKDSSAAMSESERETVVAELRRQGFRTVQGGVKARSKSLGKHLSGRYAKKCQALWIALWNLGAIEDRSDSALLAFVKRQTGIERTEWVLSPEDGAAVVEALKKMATREGVDWSTRGAVAGRHGYQVARAQHRKLGGERDFWVEVAMVLGRPMLQAKPDDAEWIRVMNAFGERIRTAKAGAAA